MEKTLKGTTTIGLVCSDGIVLVADKRASMGYFVANRNAQKIYQIDDKIAMTTAGSVGDAQTLVRWIKSEIALYKHRSTMTIKGVTGGESNRILRDIARGGRRASAAKGTSGRMGGNAKNRLAELLRKNGIVTHLQRVSEVF